LRRAPTGVSAPPSALPPTLATRAIASASRRLSPAHDSATPSRLGPASRGLSLSLALTVKQTRYRHSPRQSNCFRPTVVPDWGVKGTRLASPSGSSSLLSIFSHSSKRTLLRHISSEGTCTRQLSLRANCTGSWQASEGVSLKLHTHLSHHVLYLSHSVSARGDRIITFCTELSF
jgi:hypothetical protein